MKIVINRKKIQEEQIQRGMTASQLARAAKVNPATLRGVLEGNKEPRIDCLARIARALDLRPLDIATVEEGYNPNRKRPGPKRKNAIE